MAFSIFATVFLVCIGQDLVLGDQLYGELLPDGSAFWSYHGETGPDRWCTLNPPYPECCNVHQRESPINIDVLDTKFPAYPIHFKNYNVVPKTMSVQNTGHTVRVNYVSDVQPSLSYYHNGREREFFLDHIHFHWGSKNSEGSEHTINHKHYPMEMHLLHKAPEHDTLYEASQHPESMAVISVLFHVSLLNLPNPMLKPIIKNLRHAKYEEEDVDIQPFIIKNLLPDLHDYFTYNGSLTTPPCTDNVRWIVLHKTVPISEPQLHEFRLLQGRAKVDDPDDNAPIADNFRPTQSLSGRKVLRSHIMPIF